MTQPVVLKMVIGVLELYTLHTKHCVQAVIVVDDMKNGNNEHLYDKSK